MTKKLLSIEELKLGINAYTLVCRETKQDTLDLNFDKVLRALRVRKINFPATIVKNNKLSLAD